MNKITLKLICVLAASYGKKNELDFFAVIYKLVITMSLSYKHK